MKPSFLISSAFTLFTFSAAKPWQDRVDDLKLLDPIYNPLFRRQGDSNSQSQSSSSPEPTSSASQTDSSSNSQTTNSNSNSDSNSGSSSSATGTGKSSKSGQSDKSSGTKTTSVSINPAAGAGGVVLITPATTVAASQYYKVDNNITWVWNYTSLTSAPGAIDILATLAPQGAASAVPSPYTIATNVSFSSTQTFTWDTGEYASNTSPLPVGTYTLLIYDAGLPTYSATASPGFLGLYNQFSFGMYTGQPRVDLSDPFVCATCNAAMGRMEQMTLGFVAGMVGVTVITFTWFAGAWGFF